MEPMTTLWDRLAAVQRQYVEIEKHMASIENAAKTAENTYHNLTARCREAI